MARYILIMKGFTFLYCNQHQSTWSEFSFFCIIYSQSWNKTMMLVFNPNFMSICLTYPQPVAFVQPKFMYILSSRFQRILHVPVSHTRFEVTL